MVDIARQTVEFLYEENGGIPRDLYLPTIEDIKDEANKFTTDKVRKGTVKPLLHGQSQLTGGGSDLIGVLSRPPLGFTRGTNCGLTQV